MVLLAESALNFASVKEDTQVALNGLYELLRVINEASAFFGPLKATVGSLLSCIDAYKVCGMTELMMCTHMSMRH